MARTLGRIGEDLVAAVFGFKRVPLSGAQWPNKEDLVKNGAHGAKYLAQVKTTRDRGKARAWEELVKNAAAEGAEPVFFDVVITPAKAYVFERVLVHEEDLVGIGGR